VSADVAIVRSHRPHGSALRIAVDARSLTTRPAGVAHYLMAALNVWSEQRPEVDFLLLAHKPLHPQAAQAMRRAPNVRFEACPAALMPSNGLWWLLHAFARRAKRLGATHLWGAGGVLPPAGTRGLATLLTVHDLVFRSLPWTMSVRARIGYGLFAGRSIRRADLIWAVSAYTAREIERHYPRRRSCRIVVGSGLNPMRAQEATSAEHVADVAARYGVGPRTLLFVGTLEPRKNLAFLLSLMPLLARSGCTLLVVGASGWGRSGLATVVETPGFPREAVRFCDYVPDEDLQALYRCVAFYVSASLMEGFGLPHLEAMAAGCPVIAAANSAVIEVVADGGCLVAGWDPGAWVERIEDAFGRRDALQAAARRNAERHSIAPACEAVFDTLRSTAEHA
jgi:glycosyltransferase involved in cell wall biosynthesis